jgi:CcmD family protein
MWRWRIDVRIKSLTAGVWRAAVAGILLGLPALAWGQEPQSQFVPADTLPQEVLPATPFVFAAYAFVWLALVVYVFGLWRKVGRVERELAEVNARLAGRKN